MIRLMVVAKHAEVLDGLITILRLADNITLTKPASTCGSAVWEAGRELPDVALVDLEMPDDEGYETIRQLKEMDIRVIALTAHDYPAAHQRAFRAGAAAVMLKGLDVIEMAAEIAVTANYQNP